MFSVFANFRIDTLPRLKALKFHLNPLTMLELKIGLSIFEVSINMKQKIF